MERGAAMSGTAGLGQSSASIGAGHDPAARKSGAQAVAVAKQALDQAQGRVDADRRAHSPGCVAVDQKDVDKASAEFAQAQAAETAATGQAPAAGGRLSITV